MASFQSDGVEIAYEVAGEGAPVLLIHGFASNARVNWRDTQWIRTLVEAGHRVIAYDNRGHGKSGKLYDKAEDLYSAWARLTLLRGKAHRLHSAVVVAKDGAPIWREVVTATLTMREFSDTFLQDYLANEGEQALGSVGCYRLEGPGAQLFSRIEGDYFAILGLPLLGLLDLLRRHGELTA